MNDAELVNRPSKRKGVPLTVFNFCFERCWSGNSPSVMRGEDETVDVVMMKVVVKAILIGPITAGWC